MKHILIIVIVLFGFTNLQSQTNQFDTNQKRHGVWIKHFKNGDVRYQGEFNHGKETGVFKYYSLKSGKQPVIVKTFNNLDNSAIVKFFTPTGKLISKGEMIGKKRIGKWVYFHKNGTTIMQEEHYKNGKLEGKYTTYFINNHPTIQANYKNGLLNGSYKRYSSRGFMYQDLNYKNGLLEGDASYFDRLTGKLIKSGQYKDDIKVGYW